MSAFRLWYPLPFSRVTQRYGQNENAWYKENGHKGHTSWDWHANWDEPIPFCSEGVVYSVLNRDNPDPERYRGVYVLREVGDVVYEVAYGHLSKIYVKPGGISRPGTILGTAGNTGPVYASGVLVTKAQKLAGSRAGTHLHGPQIRKCRKTRVASGQLILDGYGVYRDKDGFFYEILDYDNGFVGCIDPAPFWNGQYAKDAEAIISTYRVYINLLLEYVGLLSRKRS